MSFLWIEDKCPFSRMFQISLMNYYINWLIKYNDKHLMTIGQSWEPVHLRVLAIICSTVFISAHPGILYIVVRIPTIHGWSEVRPVPKPKNPKTEYSRVHRFPALVCRQGLNVIPQGMGGFPAPPRPVKMIKTVGKLWGKIKAWISTGGNKWWNNITTLNDAQSSLSIGYARESKKWKYLLLFC